MTEKETNRARAPQATKVIDLFRKTFGEDCKVLYVKEGDLEMGAKATEVCRSEEV